jgi:hypothetical protein
VSRHQEGVCDTSGPSFLGPALERHPSAPPHFISIFLINAITLNAQIAPPGNAPRPEARVIAQHADRILPLLAALADQASLSADLTFAVRAQSQVFDRFGHLQRPHRL